MINHQKKVGLISLGCDKNRVDSEYMLFALRSAGYSIVDKLSQAEIIIINTCGFIESAKKESIETILEVAEHKKDGLKLLIVTGCLSERYKESLADLSEVDIFVGVNDERNIVDIIEKHENKQEFYLKAPPTHPVDGRILTTPFYEGYLKIADGCNNRCAYCAIPLIRGKYRSFDKEQLICEAKWLLSEGVREVTLVAQDTTLYGRDLYGRNELVPLLNELCKLDFWRIRLLYAYPEHITDELIACIAENEKIAKYIDIPLQHIDDGVLKKMARRSTEAEIRDLLSKIRTRCPDIAIRSTFIVGFPYEEEAAYSRLKAFISEGLIDYAGFFVYSKEEGTLAATYKERVNKRVANKRKKELDGLQTAVTIENHKKYLGREVEVLYEGIDYSKGKFYGRIEQNAADIDTKVYLSSSETLELGRIYKCKITETGFNLFAEVL